MFCRQLALAVLIAGTALFPNNLNAEAPPQKVGIGAILPLSGDAASIGEAIRNSLEMAASELPDQQRELFELLFEDDALTPKNSVSAFHKLNRSGRIAVAICAGSSPCSAIAPLAESSAIPLIAIASDPEIVLNRKFVVNLWVTPEAEVRAMIPEMARRGYKKIARITSTHDGPISVNREFDRQNLGRFTIALDQDYPLENKDFRDYLARLRVQRDLDAVFLNLFTGQLSSFAKQIRQAKIALPMFGLEMLDDANEIKAAQGALDGAWYVNASDPDDDFVRRFTARYPNSSMMCAANGYDALKLIAGALSAADKSTPNHAINKFLHELRHFRGALGTYSSSGDNRFTLPAAVKVVPLVN